MGRGDEGHLDGQIDVPEQHCSRLTKSSDEGQRRIDAVLINTNLFATDLPSYIKAAFNVSLALSLSVCLPQSGEDNFKGLFEG